MKTKMFLQVLLLLGFPMLVCSSPGNPVLPQCIADFTYPSSGLCTGQSVCFYDQSTTSVGYITQWTWDFGDGSPVLVVNFPSSPNPCHVYAGAALTHIVSLTILTNTGCTNSITKPVSLTPSPVCEFTWSSPGNCVGTCTQFTDLSQTNGGGQIVAWYWDFGDGGTSSLQNPCHVYAAAGTYMVTLTVTNANGCTATKAKSVAISSQPLANFGFPATNCAGQAVQFTDLSQLNGGGSITNWNWNFGDPASGVNNTSAAQNPVHVFAAPGSYTVTLTVTNAAGCQNTLTQIVTISPLPVPTLAGPATACAGTGGHVYITEAAMTGYLWTVSSGGDITAGGGSTDNTVTVTWNLSGPQSVSVSYSAPGGCAAASPTVYNVSVNPPPSATITAAGPTTFCEGSSVTLTASAASSYIWSTGATTQVIAATLAGTYTVTCTNSNGCQAASAPVTVTTLPLPEIPGIPSGPDTVDIALTTSSVYMSAGAPSANSYSWQLSPGNAGTVTGSGTSGTVSWNPSFLGTVTVTVKSMNSCGESPWSDAKVTIAENSTSGTGEDTFQRSWVMGPNPATGIIFVSGPARATVSVISARGIPVKTVAGFESGAVDLTGYAPGLYILTIEQPGHPAFHKRFILL